MRHRARRKIPAWRLADIRFAQHIRSRDGKCMNPKCDRKSKELQCSHYWRRDEWIARYDPDNCITLCDRCHYKNELSWEHDKHGAYRDYMRRRLGVRRFEALRQRVMKARKEGVDKRKIIREALTQFK